MPSSAFQRNFAKWAVPKKSVNPQSSVAATINGASIDRQGFLSGMLCGYTGAATGAPTAQSHTFKIQDSADGSTGWADVSGMTFNITADATLTELPADLSGAKRYVRVVTIVSFTGGTAPAQLVAGWVVLAGSDSLPV